MQDILLLSILIFTLLTAALAAAALTGRSRLLRNTEKEIRSELRTGREETRGAARELREELSAGIRATNETVAANLEAMHRAQQYQLESVTRQLKEQNALLHSDLEKIRFSFDARMKEMQEGNEKKLEEMRRVVDEKLQNTLEKRLGESFSLVSKRLEEVYRGLGEMQNLAVGVGDLKRVLTNVKARGTWAEIQLGTILEQVLTVDQYTKNARVNPGSGEIVEYAVRLPGPKDDPGACIWLPIDSKFPQEDYLRLQEAAEKGDPGAVQAAAGGLARTVRAAAGEIAKKYLNPPHTTDFGIMFLATEGLYAEVLRQPGLVEELQRKHRVVVAGPTTLTAILNSLRMGFQTLSIEKQAAEVWRVLGAVKTEFGKFGAVLSKVKRQLESAGKTIESTETRTRAMEKTLRAVEQLPADEASAIFTLSTGETYGPNAAGVGEGAGEDEDEDEDEGHCSSFACGMLVALPVASVSSDSSLCHLASAPALPRLESFFFLNLASLSSRSIRE